MTRPGIIYLSSVPEGMTRAALRQIMVKYGAVGRIFLEPYKNADVSNTGDANELLNSKSKKKKTGYNTGRYKEGWIEFEKRKDAKNVVAALNMQEIAEKRNGAF